MDKKGQTWKVIAGMVLTLVVIVLGTFLLDDVFSSFIGSTEVCQEKGERYRCVERCTGGNIQFEGEGACEEGQVCCKFPKGAKLPEGEQAESIRLKVKGKQPRYTTGEQVPEVYEEAIQRFTIEVDEELQGQPCRVYVMDGETDSIIQGKEGDDIEDDVEVTRLEWPEQSCASDGNYTLPPIKFLNSHENLEMDVIFYKQSLGGEKEASAKYHLEVGPAVEITGIDDEWNRDDTIRIKCNIKGCQKAKYWLAAGQTLQDACTKSDSQIPSGAKTVSFNSAGEAIIEYNHETAKFTIGQGTTTWIANAPVCAEVQTRDSALRSLSEEKVKVDLVPPQVDLSFRDVSCKDAGSGCASYHYKVMDEVREDDFDNLEQVGLEALKSRLKSREICPPGGYTERRIRRNTIDTEGALLANICLYGEDAAGNVGKAKPLPYVNDEAITRNFQDMALDELFNSLTSSDNESDSQ